jgi:HD superfamily phosphohydrolase
LKTFISGELDADKMDYILRDSYFSGCRYGVYNKDHLLNSLRIGYEPFMEKTNDTKQIFDVQFSLAVLEKGVGALEDFIYARYQLYLELYNHKTVSGFRKLLTLSLEEVLSIEDNKNEVKCMLSNLDSFANFTDTFFWEKFREYAKNNCRSACYMLVNRVTLPYIGKRTNEVENDIKLLCQRLSKTKNKKIDYWKSKIKFSDIDEAFNYIKVLVKQEDGTRKLKKIPRVTDFFAKFDRKDIYHLFEIPI